MKLKDLNHESEIDSFFRELKEFLSRTSRNAWLHSENDIIQVYVRKAFHRVGDDMPKTLDIANIKVDELTQGKGIGTAVVDGIHAINPFPVTFIESILNTSFYDHLKKQGWLDVPNSNPPCVYKRK